MGRSGEAASPWAIIGIANAERAKTMSMRNDFARRDVMMVSTEDGMGLTKW